MLRRIAQAEIVRGPITQRNFGDFYGFVRELAKKNPAISKHMAAMGFGLNDNTQDEHKKAAEAAGYRNQEKRYEQESENARERARQAGEKARQAEEESKNFKKQGKYGIGFLGGIAAEETIRRQYGKIQDLEDELAREKQKTKAKDSDLHDIKLALSKRASKTSQFHGEVIKTLQEMLEIKDPSVYTNAILGLMTRIGDVNLDKNLTKEEQNAVQASHRYKEQVDITHKNKQIFYGVMVAIFAVILGIYISGTPMNPESKPAPGVR